MRIKMVENIVEDVLRNKPRTRGDDFILVLEVYRNFLNPEMHSIYYAMENHKKFNLPAFASIIRARRKLQAKDPSLLDEDALKARQMQEEIMLDYVREESN